MRLAAWMLVLASLHPYGARAWYDRKPVPKTLISNRETTETSNVALKSRKLSRKSVAMRPDSKSLSVEQAGSSGVYEKSSGEQTITDHGDTYLTISLDIGSQKIKAIPDSGSFELYIVDGEDCDLDLCKPAYKPDQSKHHFAPNNALTKDIYFGSGTCGVELSFDSVKVHSESTASHSVVPDSLSPLIPLWRIVEMDDSLAGVWGDGAGFQGIVGLGFKGNVNKETKEVLLEEQVVLEAKKETGLHPTRPGMASKALFGDVFAICLPRGEDAKPVEVLAEDATSKPSQRDGRLWWGNTVPALAYTEIPVVGTRHWTMRIDSSYFQFRDSTDALHHICGGPSKAPCAALVDSGTSLIALSEEKIKELLSTTVIGDLKPDCSNVDDMPDLIFSVGGGKSLRLTPDTYVMKLSTSELPMSHHESDGRVVLEKGKVLNIRPPPASMIALKGKRGDKVAYCTHAFMETPMETALVGGTEHELIILGIPVFREYTIKFDRSRETLGFAQHPYGVTCHGENLASSFVESEPRRGPIRTLSRINELVFPNEFDSI